MSKSRDLSDFPARALDIDASGNVGIGVVPKTWFPSLNTTALQIGDTASLWSLTNGAGDLRTTLDSNFYVDASGNDKYLNTGPGTRYQQIAGEHRWSSAASGTADSTATVSDRMRINASGHITTPYQPAFHAVGSGQWSTIPSGATTYITSWGSVTERGAYFNVNTGKFFAAVSGWYSFTFSSYTRGTTSGAYVYPKLRLNGVSDFGWTGNIQHYGTHSSNDKGSTTTVTMYMTQNDYVQAAFFASNGNCDYHHGSQTFSGYLIG
jgi:hypothetical protein|tara:strand:- start:270 stop:1064 length:795 start_codon:yes stop_codon:yes gene_type:complete